MNTKIISAFPACGKTYTFKKATKSLIVIAVSLVGAMIIIQLIQIKLKGIAILNFQRIIFSTLKTILGKLITSL